MSSNPVKRINIRVFDDNDRGYEVDIHANQLKSREETLTIASIVLDDLLHHAGWPS